MSEITEKRKASRIAWREKNREKRSAYMKEWHKKHKEHEQEYQRKRNGCSNPQSRRKNCVRCGKVINARTDEQKYCSKECRIPNKEFGEGICQFCKKVFKRKNSQMIYCNERCGNKVYASRMKLKKGITYKKCLDCGEKFKAKTTKVRCDNCTKRHAESRLKNWQNENKSRLTNYRRNRMKAQRETNPYYKLRMSFGHLVSESLKRYARDKIPTKKNQGWSKLVGYTVKELMNRLESQFQEGMTWDNYGTYWDIDHKTPISWFKDKPEQFFKKGYSLENLQPMVKKENQKKNARQVADVIQTLNQIGR